MYKRQVLFCYRTKRCKLFLFPPKEGIAGSGLRELCTCVLVPFTILVKNVLADDALYGFLRWP